MGATTVMRNHRGDLVESPTYSASEAKNAFGRILDAVARTGVVTITRHDEPRAVLLSMEEYRSLVGSRQTNLDTLSAEFDSMLAHMQGPDARRAMQSAFDTPADGLGRLAGKADQR